MSATASPAALEATGIEKGFQGVPVLHGVGLRVEHESIHALVGQNGAGKSTLMKIVSGVYKADAGQLLVDGQPLDPLEVGDAHAAGIRMVFQEFSLVSSLSVSDNVSLAEEPVRGGLVDEREARKRASAALTRLGVHDIDPRRPLDSLSVGQQQAVEIAKAIVHAPKVLILDEPTASLPEAEVTNLFRALRRLRDDGLAIIYISHHIEEILELCDEVTVLRDGRVVQARAVEGLSVEDIVTSMTGEAVPDVVHRTGDAAAIGEPVLSVVGLNDGTRVQDVSLQVAPGEVVGLAGLLGSGRTETLEMLVGARTRLAGSIVVGQRSLRLGSPAAARRAGLGLVPEDRRRMGILNGQSVEYNVLGSVWRRFAPLGLIRRRRARAEYERFARSVRIKTRSPETPIERLSGGNQQKAVLARVIATAPRVLLLDEPTAGIDVGAKREIADLIAEFAADGGAVLCASSDLQELATMATRVLVFQRGRVVDEIVPARDAVLSESLLLAAVQQQDEVPSTTKAGAHHP